MVYGQRYISGLRRRGRTFGGLGLKGQPDGSSVRNIFQGSFTEEGMVSGKAIFEGGFKFSTSVARKKFNSTDSSDRRAIWGQSGSDFLVIGEHAIDQFLSIYDK